MEAAALWGRQGSLWLSEQTVATTVDEAGMVLASVSPTPTWESAASLVACYTQLGELTLGGRGCLRP